MTGDWLSVVPTPVTFPDEHATGTLQLQGDSGATGEGEWARDILETWGAARH